jgi:hypothetical protein
MAEIKKAPRGSRLNPLPREEESLSSASFRCWRVSIDSQAMLIRREQVDPAFLVVSGFSTTASAVS